MYDTSLNTPTSEIDARILKFQAALKRLNFDGALILQKSDLFYLSGTIQQANLYVPADGEPILMVNRILERARAESPIDRIVPRPRMVDELAALKAAGYAGWVSYEMCSPIRGGGSIENLERYAGAFLAYMERIA